MCVPLTQPGERALCTAGEDEENGSHEVWDLPRAAGSVCLGNDPLKVFGDGNQKIQVFPARKLICTDSSLCVWGKNQIRKTNLKISFQF